MGQARKHLGGQPRTRSAAAQAAWKRNGGVHDPAKKQKARQDRQNTRRSLKSYRLDDD